MKPINELEANFFGVANKHGLETNTCSAGLINRHKHVRIYVICAVIISARVRCERSRTEVGFSQINGTQDVESLCSFVILYSFISQFYTEVTEVETWIREKLPRVSSEDYGRDETSAQSLLRKHETLELELDSYKAKVEDLRNACQDLLKAENFDAERIQRRQVIHNFVSQI